jgi:hypothetical protein
MGNTVLQRFKQLLTVIGARMSSQQLHHAEMVVNYLRLGWWYAINRFAVERRLPDRTAVFDAVADRVRDRQVAYLEFGVFKGDSIRYWSGALKHPGARLHGFDSFEGLPEDWDDGPNPKGTFSVGGAVPQIADPRVEFFKGWFDQTLPSYTPPPHETLVITLDADLYSSTIYVLRHLRPFIVPGTFVYLDDMARPDHEPRAFKDFIVESGLAFRLIAADYSMNAAFFECVA